MHNTITDQTPGQAAAAWWAEQIGAPTFRATAEGIGPEHPDYQFGETTSFLAGFLASKHPVTEEQGRRFAEALAAKVDDRLKRASWVSLGVDYGPDLDLAEAAEAASVDLSRFPYKTHMGVTADYVTAALGYGAKSRLIWSRPGWERPACMQHHYTEAPEFEPLDED